MTAMTANNPNNRSEGVIQEFPMIAADIIYEGALVSIDDPDTDGGALPAGDVAGQHFAGVCTHEADNVSGSAGDEVVRVDISGAAVVLAGTGFDANDIGVEVFASDDQTVAKSTTNSIPVGKIIEYISATSVRVKLYPFTGIA